MSDFCSRHGRFSTTDGLCPHCQSRYSDDQPQGPHNKPSMAGIAVQKPKYHSRSEMRRIEHMKENKPDATPRDKISLKEAFEVTITLFKECQAERDALKARVAELQNAGKSAVKEYDSALKELAAAKAEIEQARLWRIELCEERDQANARIKELEADVEKYNEMYDRHVAVRRERDSLSSQLFWANDEIDALKKKAAHLFTAEARIKELNEACMQMANERLDEEWPVVKQLHEAQEREQKLVSALEEIANHPGPFLTTSNIAKAALEAHKKET